MIEFPLCKICNLFKPPKDIRKNYRRSGHETICRLCESQQRYVRYHGTLDGWSGYHEPPKPKTPEERRRHEQDLENARYHKDLEASRAKVRAKHAKYRESERAKDRQRYADNPEKYRQQAADWRARNPEKARVVSRQSQAKTRLKDPEKKRAYDREYIKRHPGTSTPGNARRRARLRQVPVIDKVTVAVLYNRDKGICSLCLQKVDKKLKFPHPQSATIDHIIPIEQGGEHSLRNTALAHYSCNSSKQARVVVQQLRLFG